jgi:hypothetical protein
VGVRGGAGLPLSSGVGHRGFQGGLGAVRPRRVDRSLESGRPGGQRADPHLHPRLPPR